MDTYIGRLAVLIRMRFNLALYADPRHFDGQVLQYAEQRRRVDIAGSPLLTAPHRQVLRRWRGRERDRCAARPYCSGLHSHGMRTWEGESLAEAARRVDELGLQIHIHAIGDAAVRQALDAIEYAIISNGPETAGR